MRGTVVGDRLGHHRLGFLGERGGLLGVEPNAGTRGIDVAHRRRSLVGSALRLCELCGILLAGRDDHGLLELVLLGVVGLLIRESELVMADGDDVAMLQGVLLDQLAVDVGAVRAVQILEEGIIEDINDQRVVATDGGIVDADVVIRQASDRITLLRHVVFSQNLVVQAKN